METNPHQPGGRDTSRHAANQADKRIWNDLTRQLDEAAAIGDERLLRRLHRRRERLEQQVLDRNTGLVQTFVRRFVRFANGRDPNADDYMSVAVTALWQAFVSWDPDRGITLGSYAWNRIKGDVQRAVARCEDPGLSYSDWTARPAVRNARDQLGDTGASIDDIAAIAGVSTTTARLALSPSPLSLDVPQGDNGRTLGDIIAEQHTDAIGTLDQQQLIDIAGELLTATELLVWLRLRGLDGAPKQTLNGLVRMMGAGNRNHLARVLAAADHQLGDRLSTLVTA